MQVKPERVRTRVRFVTPWNPLGAEFRAEIISRQMAVSFADREQGLTARWVRFENCESGVAEAVALAGGISEPIRIHIDDFANEAPFWIRVLNITFGADGGLADLTAYRCSAPGVDEAFDGPDQMSGE